MSPVPGVCSYKIPSLKWRRLQISVTSLSVALVLALSIALAGRLEVQRNRSTTNHFPVLSHEHLGQAGGAEDALHLMQAVTPRVEYGSEDKVPSNSHDNDAANVSSSRNPFGNIELAKNATESAWISFAAHTTRVTLHLVTAAKPAFIVAFLFVLAVLCVGVVYLRAMEASSRDPNELSVPLKQFPVHEPPPDMKHRTTTPSHPSPSTPSASSNYADPQDFRSIMTQQPSPKPVPGLVTSRTLPPFPPHFGIPLRQVTAFEVNANREMTIVNLMNRQAGHGKPLMWAKITNHPNQRLLQLFTDIARKNPQVKIVSTSRPRVLEIIAGGSSYGFLEAESSGKCSIVHNNEHVMAVEGDGTTSVPEIAVRSKGQQLAGLRCTQALGEPYMEFGISPGQDTMLIVAVVLAVMVLAPATWQPHFFSM